MNPFANWIWFPHEISGRYGDFFQIVLWLRETGTEGQIRIRRLPI